MDRTLQFWLPKSKIEEKNNILTVEEDIWEKKLEELKNPPKEEYVSIYLDEYEEMEKVYKIVLSASLKKINLNPWAFIPKSQVAEIEELEEDNEKGKFCIRAKKWIWKKTLDNIISSQLDYFNEGKEDADLMREKDFKLHTIVEED